MYLSAGVQKRMGNMDKESEREEDGCVSLMYRALMRKGRTRDGSVSSSGPK